MIIIKKKRLEAEKELLLGSSTSLDVHVAKAI
jgi:hypothetical protein